MNKRILLEQVELEQKEDFFDLNVSLNSTGDTLVVGASGDEENGGDGAGSAYIFKYTRDY